MKPAEPCGADVHAGAPANGLKTLQDGDVLSVVTGLLLCAARAATVICQRSSVTSKTPRLCASRSASGRRTLMYIRLAQQSAESASTASRFACKTQQKCDRSVTS